MPVQRPIALIITLVCCRLSFCHVLATAGPDQTWSTGGDVYLAQSFGQEFHCSVATSECTAADEPATGVSGATFLGIELCALCSALCCLLFALRRARHRSSLIKNPICLGLLGIGWVAFAADVAALATPSQAAWGIAVCPVAIALVLASRREEPTVPEALARHKRLTTSVRAPGV